jgi:hypothetical protein
VKSLPRILRRDLVGGQDGGQVPLEQVVLADSLVLAQLQPLDLLDELAVRLFPFLDLVEQSNKLINPKEKLYRTAIWYCQPGK